MTIIRDIQPPYRFLHDANGVALDNGYIWIGDPGVDPQSNPKAVYFDAGLTIAATQPIRTLSGYPVRDGSPARIYAEGDYSIRVMDKHGVTVYTALTGAGDVARGSTVSSIAELRGVSSAQYSTAFVLGYYSAGDGGGGPYYYDAADTTSADNGGTIIVADDGARWKLAHHGVVSIRQFGSRDGGVVDASTAIQSAVDTGLPVFVPNGTYLVSSVVAVTGTIYGESWDAVLLQGASDNTIIDCQTGNVRVESITLRGTTTTTDSFKYAITSAFATRPETLSVRNVNIEGESSSAGFTGGMYLVGVQNANITSNRIRNIRGTQSANAILMNAHIPVSAQSVASAATLSLPSTGNLFFISGTTNISAIDEGSNTSGTITLAFEDALTLVNGSSLIMLDDRNVATTAADDPNYPTFFVVFNKISSGVWEQATYSDNACNFCTISDNDIEHQTGDTDAEKFGYGGISLRGGGLGIKIVDNHIRHGNQTQISCVSTTSFADAFRGLLVSGNTCEDLTAPAISGHGYQEAAIEIGGRAESYRVVGNDINRPFRYGMWISEDGTYESNGYAVISGNTLNETQLDGIYILGTHRITVADNNIRDAGMDAASTYSAIKIQPQPVAASADATDIQVYGNSIYGPVITKHGIYIDNPSGIQTSRVNIGQNDIDTADREVFDTGFATRRAVQTSDDRYPFNNELSGYVSGTDNTTFDVLTVSVPNKKLAAVLKITFVVNSNQILRVASGEFIVTLGRFEGQNTGLSGVTVNAASVALPGGSEAFISGPTFSVSSLSGAASATQTFTVHCALDSDSNLGSNVHYRAELLSDSFTGSDELAEVSLFSA